MARNSLPFLKISHHSGVPLWRQVVDQILYAAATGLLKPGDPLPTLRELAAETRSNINTVARAYRELERLGILEMQRGIGTHVVSSPAVRKDAEALLRDLVNEFLVRAARLGVYPKDALKILLNRVEALENEGSGNDEK